MFGSFRKYLLFFITLFSAVFISVSFAASEYEETVDMMYNNGIIANKDIYLNAPNKLIPRDEFTSIIVGVSCKKCLSPTGEDIIKFSSFPFIDVTKTNQYFYCISYAKSTSLVQGYILDASGKTTCQSGKVYSEMPFCPENNIERIEAIAALLRQANLWNETLNSGVFDRSLVISDIDSYWYGYAKKGIEAGILKIDTNGKVFPHQYITRRELIELAGKIYAINQCKWMNVESENDAITADVQIFDTTNPGSCSGQGKETTFPDPYTTTYDFYAKTETQGDFEYLWEFTNISTGEVIKKTGKCLDNFDLLSSGKWLVKLTIRDKKTGKVAIAESTVDIKKKGNDASQNTLSVDIAATPLTGYAPLPVDFTSRIHSTLGGPYEYQWDFGDGSSSSLPNPDHTYQTPGVYTVTLVVRDKEGNIAVSKLVIVVTKLEDRDKDGILDKDDVCPDVFGLKELQGCPRITPYNDGKIGYDDLSNKCERDRASTIGGYYLGWAKCTSCPCESTLDYFATARACDILFPAITSPDKKTIYARGPIWQLKE